MPLFSAFISITSAINSLSEVVLPIALVCWITCFPIMIAMKKNFLFTICCVLFLISASAFLNDKDFNSQVTAGDQLRYKDFGLPSLNMVNYGTQALP